jgi:HK97 family phage portal protein
VSNWFDRLIGKKTYDANDALSVIWSELFGTGSKKVNSVKQAIEQSPWVSRAIRVLSQSSADVPWNVVDTAGKPLPGEALRLEQAGGVLTWTELLEKTVAQQALFGYSVWYPELKRVTLIDSDTVQVKLMPNGDYSYRFNIPHPGIDLANLVTLPNWTYSASPTGMGEMKSCMDSVNLEESAIELMENILGNGGLLSGILSTDQNLTEKEVEAVRVAFKEKYGGRNMGSVGVFGRGLTWQKIGVSPGDFSALDVSKITRQMIAAAFGVPAIYLMDTESVDYANSQTQERMFYQTNIQPRANRLADRITRFVFPLLGIKGKYQYDWTQVKALQEDALLMAQVDETRLRSGIVSINEVRERDGLEPMAGGESPLVSAMLVPLGYTPPEPAPVSAPVPVAEPNPAGKGLHTPEARQLIAKAYLSRTAPQEKKFLQTTMGVFHKQEKRVIAWLDAQKALKVPVEIFDEAEMLAEWRPLFLAFGMASSEATAARYGWSVIDPAVVRRWIDSRGAKYSKYVNETSNNEIMDIIARDRANGASIPDMVNDIKGYFDVNAVSRAENIARTQVIGANNYADVETYKANGVGGKEWLSTKDDRTRDDHVAADGQVVGVNEPFIVGGASLQYPGDPDGPAEEVCRCRCTELPVVR